MNYQANKLAQQGRNGDTRVAHLTEGEVVIPREVAQLRPDLIAHVSDQLRRMGGNPQQMVVGRGRRNPKTGMEEFATEAEVRAAYQQVLGREPDAAGLQYWLQPSSGFNPASFAVAAQPEIAQQRQTMQQQINQLQSSFDSIPRQQPAQPAPPPAPVAPPPVASPNRPTGTTGLINWQSMGQPNQQIATTLGTVERPEMRPMQTVSSLGLISSQMQPSSSTAQAQPPAAQNPSYISDVDLELLNRQRQGSVLDRFGVYNPYNMPQR